VEREDSRFAGSGMRKKPDVDLLDRRLNAAALAQDADRHGRDVSPVDDDAAVRSEIDHTGNRFLRPCSIAFG
jgi:hypothetical protein